MIPKDKPIAHQLSFDRFDSAANPVIFRRKKANERHHEQTRVELFRPEEFRERSASPLTPRAQTSA